MHGYFDTATRLGAEQSVYKFTSTAGRNPLVAGSKTSPWHLLPTWAHLPDPHVSRRRPHLPTPRPRHCRRPPHPPPPSSSPAVTLLPRRCQGPSSRPGEGGASPSASRAAHRPPTSRPTGPTSAAWCRRPLASASPHPLQASAGRPPPRSPAARGRRRPRACSRRRTRLHFCLTVQHRRRRGDRRIRAPAEARLSQWPRRRLPGRRRRTTRGCFRSWRP
jgi:hypothetical protein